MTTNDTTPGTEIVLSNPAEMPKFEANDLRSLSSMDDAARLVAEILNGEAILDADYEIGDGFSLLENKDALIDVPFLAIQWRFAPGDYGQEFVLMRVITQRGDKHIIVDGGTGICDQMRELTKRTGRAAGLLVQRGLRKSEYVNEFGPGTTHYLNV